MYSLRNALLHQCIVSSYSIHSHQEDGLHSFNFIARASQGYLYFQPTQLALCFKLCFNFHSAKTRIYNDESIYHGNGFYTLIHRNSIEDICGFVNEIITDLPGERAPFPSCFPREKLKKFFKKNL
jgi:hypothetical protein